DTTELRFARLDIDVLQRDAWFAGVSFARGVDQRVWSNMAPYDGVDTEDTTVLVYTGLGQRRGRSELRGGLGAGLVSSATERWNDDHAFGVRGPRHWALVLDGAVTASVDLIGPLALAIGPTVTFYNQSFPPTSSDPEQPELRRIANVAFASW